MLREQARCQEIEIWNNKLICIQGKSIFCEALFQPGIITLDDLTTEENGASQVFNLWQVHHLRTPKEKFQLINDDYRRNFNTTSNKSCYQNNSMCSNSVQLHPSGNNIYLDKAFSRNIYKEVRSKGRDYTNRTILSI